MRSHRKLRQSPATKLKRKQILIYAVAGTILALLVGIGLFFYLNLGANTDSKAATPDFYSVSKGFWTEGATWSGGFAPTTTDIDANIEVYEFISTTTDLNYKSGSNKTLTIIDTLLVRGNLTMGNKTNIIVKEGGVLIVTMNFTADNKIEVENGGVVVIGGDMIFPTNNQDTYNESNGKLFVIGDVVGNAAASGSAQNEDALQQEYPDIHDILGGGNSVMPITLVYFKTKPLDDSVEIIWKTAEEKNNDFFTIERSSNGKNFQVIKTIKGAGDSQVALSYKFIDESPLLGASYYRLKQTDFDGKFEYFDIIPVHYQHSKLNAEHGLDIVSIGPNPFNSMFTVEFELPEDGEVVLNLMDFNGNTLATERSQAYAGRNKLEFQENDGLKPGTYLMILTHPNYQSKAIKIIKK